MKKIDSILYLRRRLPLLAPLLGVVFAFMLVMPVWAMEGQHSAYAAPPLGGGSMDQGANVSQGFSCFIFVPPQMPFTTSIDSHQVQTPSGVTELTCHFITTSPPQTVISTGWPCSSTNGRTTTDSRAVYSKSGNITITCLFPRS